MPGSKRQRTDLKTSIQQRQEQQRARPTSTAKTSGGGLGGQQRQGMTATWAQVASSTPDPYSALVECLTPTGQPQPAASIPFPAPVATQPAPALSPAAPTLPELRARLDAELAPLPRHGEPLTPAQEAALDLLDQLASDLAHRITDPASVHALIDRLPDLGTGCGRAVANALREAQ